MTVKITNLLEGKADCVYSKMVDNNYNINWILDNFNDGDKPSEFNLILRMSSTLSDNTNASTVKSGNTFYININSNRIPDRTSLSIARTIIHESVHAWLSYLNQGPPSDLKTELLTYLQNNGYDYEDKLMSEYAPALASSIAAWDNYRLVNSSTINEFNYYNALSFSGEMLNSIGFTQLSPSEQQMVLDANTKEGDAVNPSANDAKGLKCP